MEALSDAQEKALKSRYLAELRFIYPYINQIPNQRYFLERYLALPEIKYLVLVESYKRNPDSAKRVEKERLSHLNLISKLLF